MLLWLRRELLRRFQLSRCYCANSYFIAPFLFFIFFKLAYVFRSICSVLNHDVFINEFGFKTQLHTKSSVRHAQFQLFQKVKISFWNLEKLKKREFNFFQTSKSSKNMSLILCERKKAQKHHFFSSLKTLKKHEFNFLQVTKVQKTSF